MRLHNSYVIRIAYTNHIAITWGVGAHNLQLISVLAGKEKTIEELQADIAITPDII